MFLATTIDAASFSKVQCFLKLYCAASSTLYALDNFIFHVRAHFMNSPRNSIVWKWHLLCNVTELFTNQIFNVYYALLYEILGNCTPFSSLRQFIPHFKWGFTCLLTDVVTSLREYVCLAFVQFVQPTLKNPMVLSLYSPPFVSKCLDGLAGVTIGKVYPCIGTEAP
jgi:hypothetical protein